VPGPARAKDALPAPEAAVNDAIDVLLEEHRQLMVPIHNLRRVVESLATRGEEALPEARSVLAEVALLMTTRLLDHARKEDDALFPALERTFDRNHGPTAVLRAEHQDIEARAHLFKRTVHELEHVEHPAILARGQALGALAAGQGDVPAMVTFTRDLISLLESHFGKEEEILFPMARQMLSPAELLEIARQMESQHAERQSTSESSRSPQT
jgi:regulator of cell morphogenesis and NO signaling